MKTLLILRHAKSSWKRPELSDHDRPLNKRGKRDAPRMGQLLSAEDRVPDLILSSTARRARDTAVAVALSCGYDGLPELHGSLYGADPDECMALLRQVGGKTERIMIVAHNPGMAALVEQLTDREERFPTAALAEIGLPIVNWSDLDEETEGELRQLWRPRELT